MAGEQEKPLPIDRLQNETLSHYLERLYVHLFSDTKAIVDAMHRDPQNFGRLINSIPEAFRVLRENGQ